MTAEEAHHFDSKKCSKLHTSLFRVWMGGQFERQICTIRTKGSWLCFYVSRWFLWRDSMGKEERVWGEMQIYIQCDNLWSKTIVVRSFGKSITPYKMPFAKKSHQWLSEKFQLTVFLCWTIFTSTALMLETVFLEQWKHKQTIFCIVVSPQLQILHLIELQRYYISMQFLCCII